METFCEELLVNSDDADELTERFMEFGLDVVQAWTSDNGTMLPLYGELKHLRQAMSWLVMN